MPEVRLHAAVVFALAVARGALLVTVVLLSAGCQTKEEGPVADQASARPSAEELQLPYETFLARARSDLAINTASYVRMFKLDQAAWSADLDAGTITFTCPEVVITSPVQVVGTYNRADSTWLWAWDHPSVAKPLAKAAESVRQYGRQKGLSKLTTRKLSCSEQDAWDFAALACKLYGGQGVYRGLAGDTLVFFVYEQVNAKKRQ